MTEIMKAGSPAVVSVLMLGANRINDVPAGEDVASGDATHIHALQSYDEPAAGPAAGRKGPV